MTKIALEKVVKPLKVVKVVVGSRAIAPEENYPLTQILTLNQTLTLTGGNFPWGQLPAYYCCYIWVLAVMVTVH